MAGSSLKDWEARALSTVFPIILCGLQDESRMLIGGRRNP
jgi:hypothetical protein